MGRRLTKLFDAVSSPVSSVRPDAKQRRWLDCSMRRWLDCSTPRCPELYLDECNKHKFVVARCSNYDNYSGMFNENISPLPLLQPQAP